MFWFGLSYFKGLPIWILCKILFCWAPAPTDRDYRIGSNIWKFYLIRIGFTLGEPVSLVKVLKLFRSERIFFNVQSVDTVGRCTTSLSIGRARVLVMPCFTYPPHYSIFGYYIVMYFNLFCK